MKIKIDINVQLDKRRNAPGQIRSRQSSGRKKVGLDIQDYIDLKTQLQGSERVSVYPQSSLNH